MKWLWGLNKVICIVQKSVYVFSVKDGVKPHSCQNQEGVVMVDTVQ